jgi:branched-chain amino acid transport system substrate-binding protein
MTQRARSLFLGLLTFFGLALAVGCDKPRSGQPAADQTVRIGAILPLTGPTAYLGVNERLGMQIALDERGPSATPKVEFVFEDSKGTADLALSAMRKLLHFQDIRFHVVTTTTPVLATLPAYAQAGKSVLVIAQCMVPEVTKGYPFAYRLYATSDEETDLLSAYAKQQGFQRVGALHIQNRFGEEGVNYFSRKFTAAGGQVPLVESFAFTATDFRTTLAKFRELNLDAILIYAYSTNFPVIFQQMQEAGLNLPVLGNVDLALGGLQDKVNPDFLSRVVFPAPRYYFAQDSLIQAFNAKVRARGTEPNFDIAYSYDMARVLIRALENADEIAPDAVGREIMELMPYQGVTGTIRLTADRDLRSDMRLVRWGPNGIELVASADSVQAAGGAR